MVAYNYGHQLFLAAIGIRCRISLPRQIQNRRFPDSDANRPFIGMKSLERRISNSQEQQGGRMIMRMLWRMRRMDRNMPGRGNTERHAGTWIRTYG